MLLEMHIIQNFAPSNLNRDDSGMPKDCEFGGFRRARISSQCLKRNIRTSNAFTKRVETGVRTRNTVKLLTELTIQHFNKNETDALNIAKAVAIAITKKIDEKENKTQYLYYTDKLELLGILNELFKEQDVLQIQLNTLQNQEAKKTEIANAQKEIEKLTEKALANYLKTNSYKINSIDIALFGRMLADQPTMKIDAACQVAHAISTNKVTMDFDYFTAIDDLNPQEETGAGMIGNIGFNSSCFYRYSSLNIDKLLENIGNKKDQAIQGILGFIEGSIEAIPTGKQTSFAANNLPAYTLITIKKDNLPISLANAFEKPVSPKHNLSLSETSTQKLIEYFNQTKKLYNLNFEKEYEFGIKIDEQSNKQQTNSYISLIEQINNYLNEKL